VSRLLTLAAASAAVVAALAALAGPAAPAGAEPVPNVKVTAGDVAPGTTVPVGGQGWSPFARISLQVCGNEGRSPSADCDQSSSRIVGAWQDGTVHADLAVDVPPRPCPCVVRAWSFVTDTVATAPLAIRGAPWVPSSPAATTVPSTLSLIDARVREDASWATWFGAPAGRVLELTVRNAGTEALVDPPVRASWGGDHLFPVPPSGTIDAGATRTITVPFDLEPFTTGDLPVAGTMGALGAQVTFTTSTSGRAPVGLPVVLVVPLAVVVLAAHRRRARAAALVGAADEPTGTREGRHDDDAAASPTAADTGGVTATTGISGGSAVLVTSSRHAGDGEAPPAESPPPVADRPVTPSATEAGHTSR
jgi:hypothetical protein